MDELQKLQQSASTEFALVLKHFGEDAKTTPEEFFGIVQNFLREYEAKH
jgi:hypothetical protein